MSDIVSDAAAAAVDVLRRCVTPAGFRASAEADGYAQLWARDAMMTLLGACAAELEEFVPAMRASLVTLTAAQRPLGYVPLNVEPDGAAAEQGDPGGVDGNLWYLIGHHVLHRAFGIDDLLDHHRQSLVRAMRWCRYQDSDDDGLLESQEAADWADLLANRGKVLYVNALYALALLAYADLAEWLGLPDGPEHRALAGRVSARLNELHWVASPLGLWDDGHAPGLRSPHAETRRLVQLTTTELWNRPYFLPWVGFRDYGDWCDVLGNSLAILGGIADAGQRTAILDHLARVGIAEPLPARAIDPPIHPGDRHWRGYYRNGNLGLPHQYHNGGCWPMVGGFLIAAQVADGRIDDARAHLGQLAGGVRAASGDWEFGEWYHGLTGQPMGKRQQAWSAALLLFAQRAVTEGHVPGLPVPRVLSSHPETGIDQLGPS